MKLNQSNQLIPVTQSEINGDSVQTVNARELHEFLGVGRDFSSWIKNRIDQYDFIEGRDFLIVSLKTKSLENPDVKSFPQNGGKPHNQDFTTFTKISVKGRPAIEYHISLDMAKELSMVERNDKGKQARQYFIECERKAKGNVHDVLSDPSAMRGLLLSYTEKVIALEEENKVLSVDSEALSRIAKAEGSLCVTDAAKSLQMRPKDLFTWLRSNKWIYRRTGCAHDCAYQDKQIQGLLEHKVTTVSRSDGSEKITEQVRITPKGLEKLSKLIPDDVGRTAKILVMDHNRLAMSSILSR